MAFARAGTSASAMASVSNSMGYSAWKAVCSGSSGLWGAARFEETPGCGGLNHNRRC